MNTSERKDRVLVVDDLAANIDILMEVLDDEYEVVVAMDGESALQSVAERTPDIILLDIMMPGIDGHEVCRLLKSEPATADIPILFLTALQEEQDEEKGLGLGAVDYITKPLNPILVKARVKNQLSLVHARRIVTQQRDHIEENYARLRELENLRDDLVQMMVHDLRSPLTGVCGNLEYALRYSKTLDQDTRDCLQVSRDSGSYLCTMISSMLDVNKLENGEFPLQQQACDLNSLIHNSICELGSLTKSHQLCVPTTKNSVPAFCDPEVIERVLTNLIANAIKFTPEGGKIEISITRDPHEIRLSIADTGPGIPLEFQEKVFEKFGQVKGRRLSTGLGLTFCKLAISAHGGNISLESEPGNGSTFHITLPALPAE
jgi:signal transduction histidine kinase